MTYTSKATAALIGKVGLLPDAATHRVNGIEYSVRIEDVKQSYGQTLVLVSPVQGNGSAWVRLDRIRELHDDPRFASLEPRPSLPA